MPHKEDYNNISKLRQHQKKKCLCKIHKFFEKYNVPHGYFNMEEIIPNKDNTNTKRA